MKGFIEVELSSGDTALINVLAIESVVLEVLDNTKCAIIYMISGDEESQTRFRTEQSYEEVKAMIEEAMK